MMTVLLMVAACQPQIQPFQETAHAAELRSDAIVMPDGAALPLRSWLPDDEPKAVILALHGFNDYSHAFELPGHYLKKQGIAVYAYDQRGFGATQPHGIWAREANLLRDLRTALALLKAQYPDLPLYVLGESMGAAVTINACAQGAGCPQADGMMLVAPALWGDDVLSGIYRLGVWLMAHTVPDRVWTGEDLEISASDNKAMLYAMGRDPLVIKQTRSDAVYGLVQLMAQANENVSKLQKPVLVLYGAKDEIVPPYPVAMAVHRLKAPYTMAYYKNGYHMLLRDLQREVVFKDIGQWVKNRYNPLPSGADMGWKEEMLVVDEE